MFSVLLTLCSCGVDGLGTRERSKAEGGGLLLNSTGLSFVGATTVAIYLFYGGYSSRRPVGVVYDADGGRLWETPKGIKSVLSTL